MTNRIKHIAIISALAGASIGVWSGCSPGALKPVAPVGYEALKGHREALRDSAREHLEAGQAAAAFYALEVDRTRTFATGPYTVGGQAQVDAAMSDLRWAYDFSKVGDGGALRGVVATGAYGLMAEPPTEGTRAAAPAPGSSGDEVFWEGLGYYIKRREAWLRAEVPIEQVGLSARAVYNTPYAVATPDEVRLAMAPGDGLLRWHIAPDGVHAFLITHRDMTHTPLEVAPEALARQVTALRGHITCAMQLDGLEGCSPTSWEAPAQALYEALFTPLETALEAGKVRRLLVIPEGPISNLPLNALKAPDGRLLLDRFERVAWLPSASFYLRGLSRRRPARPPSMLAVGDPTSSWVKMPSLGSARLEARVLGDIFPGSTTLTGTRATEGAFRAALAQHDLIHLATHGLLHPRRPDASALLLADDESHDGLLSAAEVRALSLGHTRAVVLSACETSVSQGDARGEELTSLVTAFLLAGAGSVVGSLWQVEDTSTTALMLEFYTRLSTHGAGQSLQDAQRTLRDDPSFSHPIFWAAFVAWGLDLQ